MLDQLCDTFFSPQVAGHPATLQRLYDAPSNPAVDIAFRSSDASNEDGDVSVSSEGHFFDSVGSPDGITTSGDGNVSGESSLFSSTGTNEGLVDTVSHGGSTTGGVASLRGNSVGDSSVFSNNNVGSGNGAQISGGSVVSAGSSSGSSSGSSNVDVSHPAPQLRGSILSSSNTNQASLEEDNQVLLKIGRISTPAVDVTLTEIVTRDLFETITNVYYNSVPVTLTEFIKTTIVKPTLLVSWDSTLF